MPRGSLPWILIAAILGIMTAIFLESALFHPFAEQFMALDGWRGSDLMYANEGMRMIGQFVKYILVVVVVGIAFGVILDARRGV